jgi:integrase
MRRAATCNLDLSAIDFQQKSKSVTVREKGGQTHRYKISKEGAQAILDYLREERDADSDTFPLSNALFLPAATNANSSGRLTPGVINTIWNEACLWANVRNKTPHAARHAMGRHIMDKKGNVAAVQRQLGHKNAAYSLQYARITDAELQEVVDER